MFSSILIFVHVFVCLIIIGLVLLQQGKGANLGASFGGGGDSFFGATGADNILTRVTTIAAIIFMATSLSLAVFSNRDIAAPSSGLIDSLPEAQPKTEQEPEKDATEQTPSAAPSDKGEAEKNEGADSNTSAPESKPEETAGQTAPAPAPQTATQQPVAQAPSTEAPTKAPTP